MNCPKCKNITLRKKGYDSPFNCHKCGGMWLEFDRIPRFFDSISQEATSDIGENIYDDKAGFCPSGHGLLTRAKVEDSINYFYLEKCSTCGGIWFDNDEWKRIANNKLVSSLNEIWCTSWQTQQRKQKSRDTYLKNNKNILGDEVFNKIIELSLLLKDSPEKGRAIAFLKEEINI